MLTARSSVLDARLSRAAGPFSFILRNVTFAGGHVHRGQLSAGQHCGSHDLSRQPSTCNVQYVLDDVRFEHRWVHRRENEVGGRIAFGASGGDPVAPFFLSRDGHSLGPWRSVVSGALDGFARLDGCAKLDETYSHGIGCQSDIRRLNIFSPNQGVIRLRGPGYVPDGQTNWEAPVHGRNGGFLGYDPMSASSTFGYGGYVSASASCGRQLRPPTPNATGSQRVRPNISPHSKGPGVLEAPTCPTHRPSAPRDRSRPCLRCSA